MAPEVNLPIYTVRLPLTGLPEPFLALQKAVEYFTASFLLL
jgi:hypothetical protein